MVTVRLFGLLQEKFGKSRLDAKAGTVREVLSCIAKTEAEEKLLQSCVMFINNKPLRGAARLAAKLRDGDELALLPPAGGG